MGEGFVPADDAVAAYEAAEVRARRVRDEWERLGMPVTERGSRGQLVPHPLLKAMHECEVVADRLRQRVLPKHRGPEPSAVLRPDGRKSPSQRLREAG